MVDRLFAVLVCGLAFLLAATAARNSDLWLHLASGRMLMHGQSPRGTDPFAFTTQGVFWVNHSWLSDLVLYELHERGGGRALVVAKSILLTVLAALLLCFRRRGTPLGIVAFAAVGVLLALGPWLALQPVLLSLLGVALTLYLLERPGLLEGPRSLLSGKPLSPCTQEERGWGEGVEVPPDTRPLTPNPSPPSTGERGAYRTDSERARSRRWLLVPLFALWANLDAWFLLGPVLVGLYALGELLHRRSLRTLAPLALAGLAACLMTPYHYHTFAWPNALGFSHTEQALLHDPLGQGLVVSSFGARFAASPVFASPGAWAYYLLLAAGAVSFVLAGRSTHPGRLLVWLGLGGLSIYQARAIFFFAVAAGPILALNLQEWRQAYPLSEPLGRARRVTRGMGVLLGIVLLVLAWPGWLQPAPYQPRSWEAEPDGSLVRLARWLQRWHEDGRLRPDRFALNFSPEVAHHLAWFCPAEKGFLDSRWPLFDGVADDFVHMRRILLQPDIHGPGDELVALLDRYAIDRIIVHDLDWGRTTRAFRSLLRREAEWELLAVEGGATLFGRRAGEPSHPEQPFDYRRAAYHPESESRAPLAAPRAPQQPTLFDSFHRRREDRHPDREEAALHLIFFDFQTERMQANVERQWLLAQATGLVGAGSGSASGGAVGALALRLSLTLLAPPLSSAPSEPLLLAVRAGRRALSVDPEDAGAFLLLGEAYFRLSTQPRARGWQTLLPTLAVLRRAQVLTALEQAVLLRPDLDRAHALLIQLYYETGQLDRTLDHMQARLRIAEQDIKNRGVGAEAASERLPPLRTDVEKMEAEVRRAEKVYEANTAGKTDPSRVLDRARLAARHGLTRKALEMLLASYPAIFGKAGVDMQLDLMLRAGRAYELRSWLGPEHERELGFSPYHSLQAQLAAACGDYPGADAELDALCEPLRFVRLSANQLVPVRSAVALRASAAVLTRPVVGEGCAGLAGAVFLQFETLKPLGGPAGLLTQEADWRVLRGMLALESGDVEAARQHFRAAVEVWGSDSQTAVGGGLDFSARPVARQALDLLE